MHYIPDEYLLQHQRRNNLSAGSRRRRTTKVMGGVTSQFLYGRHDVATEIGGAVVGAIYLRSLTTDVPFIRQTSTGNEHYHGDALGQQSRLEECVRCA